MTLSKRRIRLLAPPSVLSEARLGGSRIPAAAVNRDRPAREAADRPVPLAGGLLILLLLVLEP